MIGPQRGVCGELGEGRAAFLQISPWGGRFLGFNPLPGGAALAERLANFRTGQGKIHEVLAVEFGIAPSTLAK